MSDVVPSMIGYEQNETIGGARRQPLARRRMVGESQPTVMSAMGLHSLPPVSFRMPISDQYAAGIARPDLDMRTPDPTIYTNVNGNVSIGQTPEERRAAQMELRGALRAQRLARGSLVD
jgi:hypothetical protein